MSNKNNTKQTVKTTDSNTNSPVVLSNVVNKVFGRPLATFGTIETIEKDSFALSFAVYDKTTGEFKFNSPIIGKIADLVAGDKFDLFQVGKSNHPAYRAIVQDTDKGKVCQLYPYELVPDKPILDKATNRLIAVTKSQLKTTQKTNEPFWTFSLDYAETMKAIG
jgi:hypothetical protein